MKQTLEGCPPLTSAVSRGGPPQEVSASLAAALALQPRLVPGTQLDFLEHLQQRGRLWLASGHHQRLGNSLCSGSDLGGEEARCQLSSHPSCIGRKQDDIPPGSTQLPLFIAAYKLCALPPWETAAFTPTKFLFLSTWQKLVTL